jgi:isoleucyl-tRNA synthetase
MPYAQAHYPFEHAERFLQENFPADFIAEGLDQTRGWFYTLLVLSTAIFDQPAFKNCVVNGILLGSDGQKMSKSLRNYPSLDHVFETYGADALRFVLLSSPATQAQTMLIKDEFFREAVKDLLLPILNIYKFFAEIANVSHFVPETLSDVQLKDLSNPLDKWLIYRVEQFKIKMTKYYDVYDLINGCGELKSFVQDISRWYVRNIKADLKDSTYRAKAQSLNCLHFTLEMFSKCAAPLVPFMSDFIYRSLFGLEHSVHLEDWPKKMLSETLEPLKDSFTEVERVREITNLCYQVRDKENIPLRQRLPVLYLDCNLKKSLEPHQELICHAVNVEQIEWDYSSKRLNFIVKLNDKVLGPKYRNNLRNMRLAIERGDYKLSSDQNSLCVLDATLKLDEGGYLVEAIPKEGVCGARSSNIWVALNTHIDEALLEKSHLRALEREVNRLRKSLSLTARDTIKVYLTGSLSELALKYQQEFCANTISILISQQPDDKANASNILERLNKDTAFNGEMLIYCDKPKELSTVWSLTSIAGMFKKPDGQVRAGASDEVGENQESITSATMSQP